MWSFDEAVSNENLLRLIHDIFPDFTRNMLKEYGNLSKSSSKLDINTHQNMLTCLQLARRFISKKDEKFANSIVEFQAIILNILSKSNVSVTQYVFF